MPNPPLPHSLDIRLKLVALSLEPALVLSRIIALPLNDLQDLVATGYFREARARGLSYRTIARRFDKSLRTIATLAKEADSHDILPSATAALTTRRRILELIAKRRRITRVALSRAMLNVDSHMLEHELEQLCRQGLLRDEKGTLRAAQSYADMTAGGLAQRLDAVRHLLTTVTQVIYQKFFHVEGEQREAFARTFTFRADGETLEALRKEAYDGLRAAVLAADKAAAAEGPTGSVVLCVVETPDDRPWSGAP